MYVPVGPGVWVRLGHRHPLQASVPAPARGVLLLDAPWELLELPELTSLYEHLELPAPTVVQHPAAVDPPRLAVRLRLVDSGVSPAPTLWVLRDGTQRVEHLLEHLPDELIERLLFAVADDVVLLRARPHPAGPPTVEIDAETYTPLLELPNLFRPTDATLEPPLRRSSLRELLAPAPDELAWLARTDDGFRVERIAEEAFRPLTDWVDYVVARDQEALAGWLEAASFAFDEWVDVGVEWSDRPSGAAQRRRTASAEPDDAPDGDEPEEPVPLARPSATTLEIEPTRVQVVADAGRSALSQELQDVESAFRTSAAEPDDAERIDLWLRMANLHRQLGNAREATLCWVHAVWERPDDPDLARRWAEEELGAVEHDLPGLRDAVLADPHPDLLRATGAALAAGALTGDATLTPVFDANSELVDVRTAWLARSRIAGDDDLALARARDDVLQRIRQGLAVERDVPAFVRSFDAHEATGVVEQLAAQLTHFRTTKRKRNVLEADLELTGAYVDLVFAWGFASVGERERVDALLARVASNAAIDRTDVVHDALITAYEARIQQALTGVPRDAPLPGEASAKLQGLPDLERYQVDRLRAASNILESRERLNPFKTYERRFQDARGPEFADLRGITDPIVLEPALSALVEAAPHHDEPARLIDGIFDFLPMLSAASAVPHLDALLTTVDGLPPLARAQLLTDALVVAGLLGQGRRARDLASRVRTVLAELPVADLGSLTDGLSGSLRSLRRVGLQDEARELLEAVERALLIDPASRASGYREDHASRLIRASAVGGLLALRVPGALDELDVLLQALAEKHTVVKRLQLTRALGLALASAPRTEAFARLPLLSEHLPQITDGFGTNSHFCLSIVGYAESVVLGYADTELGSEARAWIDASEFRVRRRIHAGRVS